MKKFIAAFLALAMLAALAPNTVADSGGVKPYNGLIGADSPFYKLKVGWQKLDVALTFDSTEKMKKQMNYAEERMQEAYAMALANNTGALESALDEYEEELGDLNETTLATDINETEYANLEPLLYHHQQCFYGMLNNSTMPIRTQDRIRYMCNQTIRVKNGMPFYYYNGTAYFLPPGQMNKITNGSKVPPGLAKKGYVLPSPTVVNGSNVWPWDEISYPTPVKTKGNGNGHGNPNR